MSNESPTTPLSTESILHGRLDQIISTLSGVNTKVDTVISGQLDHSAKLGSLEQRVTTLEEARKNDSLPARVVQESQTNTKQDAVIADLVVKVKALEVKVVDIGTDTKAIKTAVTGFFTNKKVLFVGKVIFGLAMAYAAAKGIKVLP